MQWWRVTMRRKWLLRCAALVLRAARVAVDMVAMMPPACVPGKPHAGHSFAPLAASMLRNASGVMLAAA